LRCVYTDGTIVVGENGDDNLFGSTVTLRQSKGIVEAYTIIVDTKHALPTGVLQYFYLFIELADPSAPPSSLWLYVWRKSEFSAHDHYLLVWRRLVYLNDSSPQALYAVRSCDDSYHASEVRN